MKASNPTDREGKADSKAKGNLEMRDMNCAGPIHSFQVKPKRLSNNEVKKEIAAFGRIYRFCSDKCASDWKKAEFK